MYILINKYLCLYYFNKYINIIINKSLIIINNK